METKQKIISVKLKKCLIDKGYTAVSFANRAGISETVFRSLLKTGIFDGNENEYKVMIDQVLMALQITMEDLLHYHSLSEKRLTSRVSDDEAGLEKKMAGKREYELLLDILDLCSVYYEEN